MTEHFSTLSQRFIERRTLLRVGVNAVGAAVLVGCTPPMLRSDNTSTTGNTAELSNAPGFESLPHDLQPTDAVAKNYTSKIVIRWGDTLAGDGPAAFPLNAKQQSMAFGYNNDFLAYIPLDGSQRGLLCANHEYCLPQLMFPGYANWDAAVANMPAEEIRSEMMAAGHTVFEVSLVDNRWQPVRDSQYARRITALTSAGIDGPAAGHPKMKTSADPLGAAVYGVLGGCAGGKTPWGTVLIAEENFGDFFAGDPSLLNSENEITSAQSFGVGKESTHWARLETRFNINREPNELNRFGWIVELDPTDPNSQPIKHSALGRFEHEGATVVAEPGKPAVVYSGDDHENECLYRFVSKDNYLPGAHTHNRGLLTDGTLYTARFSDDGTGEWLPMRQGEGPLQAEAGFHTQADVVIDCRRAAQLLGATPMDRPEDFQTNPSTGRVYVALSKNEEKAGTNSANPKSINPTGHIIELLPPGEDGKRDHLANTFAWDFFLVAGDPSTEGKLAGFYGSDNPPAHWFMNPDNIAFDVRNRLWVTTDGCRDFGFADGIWCAATSGEARANPRQLYRAPTGAEASGPAFTPDGKTLFVSIQHPGDDKGSTYGQPSTRWPDFDESIPPRPSVIAITRKDGGLIGD